MASFVHVILAALPSHVDKITSFKLKVINVEVSMFEEETSSGVALGKSIRPTQVNAF